MDARFTVSDALGARCAVSDVVGTALFRTPAADRIAATLRLEKLFFEVVRFKPIKTASKACLAQGI
ncbi:hypothetical protein [Microcoleus sp. B4-D1]|uniref:hypothetical protein n=1 Tax=Microcoleus sp. B4-D1 TaxID=2818666 RepID=UPI002FD3670E